MSHDLFRLAAVFATCFLTGCGSGTVPEKLVTYSVAFDADGQHYERTASYLCYFINIPATSARGPTWEVDQNRTSIHGVLPDGSKYQINQGIRRNPCADTARTDIQSRIYVQWASRTTPSVESFDTQRSRSAHHVITIERSFLDVHDKGLVDYDVARKDCCGHPWGAPPGVFYYSVGAQLTPFTDTKQAQEDFYNTGGATPGLPENRIEQPKFNFHPLDANLEKTAARVSYDGNSWTVDLLPSNQASPWAADKTMSMIGQGITHTELPDQSVSINGQTIRMPIGPSRDRTFYLDPTLNRVVILFIDREILQFDHHG